MARNTADRKTCAQICAQTAYRSCDAEVSIYGNKGKATKNGMIVGTFHNYFCDHGANGASEVVVVSEQNYTLSWGSKRAAKINKSPMNKMRGKLV